MKVRVSVTTAIREDTEVKKSLTFDTTQQEEIGLAGSALPSLARSALSKYLESLLSTDGQCIARVDHDRL